MVGELWEQLGIGRAIGASPAGPRPLGCGAGALHDGRQRCLEPASKLEATHWVGRDSSSTASTGSLRISSTGRWTSCSSAPSGCRSRSSSPSRRLLNLEVDLLFFDTTSTYFEIDVDDPIDDDEASDGRRDRSLRRLGHSKDHRPDLPQVVIGLAVTREGIPVRVWVWPGNTNDQSVLRGQGRSAPAGGSGA